MPLNLKGIRFIKDSDSVVFISGLCNKVSQPTVPTAVAASSRVPE